MPPLSRGHDALWQAICPSFCRWPRRASILLNRTPKRLREAQCHYNTSVQSQNDTQLAPKLFQSESFEIRKYVRQIPEWLISKHHEDLRKAGATGDYHEVQKLLTVLIQEHREKLDQRLYHAALLANTDAQYGSAANVSSLLQEMIDEGIIWDSAICHAALKVLAVHPDYLLRQEILEELHRRWFTLSGEGWHDIIVGLIRDKQLEMAFETMETVQQQGVRLERWLYDLLLYNLCDAGELDAALSVLRHRSDNGDLSISGTIWAYFLDAASSQFHYEATEYAYRKRVEPGYLNPSSGVCINILNTAARHGDHRLAMDVFRVLSNRSQKLQHYHYEALVASYLKGGDLRTALTLLIIMSKARIPPSASEISTHIRKSPALCVTALKHLKELNKEGKSIPATAVNCIIDAYLDMNDLTSAISTYRTLCTLCPSGPTIDTFNGLFRGCREALPPDKDQAMHLAKEMVAMKIKPNSLTYDRLILVCIQADGNDMEDAWRYFDEMRGMGFWPRPGTLVELARKGCKLLDQRVWKLEEKAAGQKFQEWLRREWKGGEGGGVNGAGSDDDASGRVGEVR
ncbi:MAG: hypothetical protein Q9190_007049 [Brigantiaea leucoxantha]